MGRLSDAWMDGRKNKKYLREKYKQKKIDFSIEAWKKLKSAELDLRGIYLSDDDLKELFEMVNFLKDILLRKLNERETDKSILHTECDKKIEKLQSKIKYLTIVLTTIKDLELEDSKCDDNKEMKHESHFLADLALGGNINSTDGTNNGKY